MGMLLRLSLLGLLGACVLAQDVPACEKTCSDAALSSSGCSSPADTCACDDPYQSQTLQCMAKPGGCSYEQIISWTQRQQTQCFLSPPIVPDCLIICPLQGLAAAGCDSASDLTCVCGDSFRTTTGNCIQAACSLQYDDWVSTIKDQCSGVTVTSNPTGTATQTTRSGTTTSSPTTTRTGSSSTRTSTSTTQEASGERASWSALVVLVAIFPSIVIMAMV